MTCPYAPTGKKKGCPIYKDGQKTCDKSLPLDLEYCGKYRELEGCQ